MSAAAAPASGAPAGAPIIRARDLAFRHPGAAAPLFDGLDLAVEAGTSVAIVGPNGAGKTTLLRLLCGILPPLRGEVLLDGRPALRIPARERARLVGFVPQEADLLFDWSVLEVVLMGRAPRHGPFGLERPADFEAARAALHEVDLAAAAERPLRALSSGERQRALIARALAQEPRLLLLDEPTAFLDLRHRLQILDILLRLNRERGLTVVTVSHDLNLAARYAGRLAVLHRGRLAADGPPDRVLTADLVRAVYETDAVVERDPVTGGPLVIPRAPLPFR